MRALMSQRSALALFAIVVATHVSCGGGGGRVVRTPGDAPAPSQPSGPRSPLEGNWTLVGLETASGPRRVQGFLRYDRFSNIAVRAELAADDPAARPPRTVVADFTARASTSGGELEFMGLQSGPDADRLAQDAVRMDEWRVFAVSGDTLRLSVRGGGATLVFQRAP
jgi:hypothetical protein